MNTHYKIDLVIFPTPIYVVFGAGNFLELLQELGYGGKFILPYSAGIAETHILDLPEKTHAIVILLPETESESDAAFEIDEIGTIIHEAVHACDYLAESVGEKRFNEETRAYLIEHIAVKAIQATISQIEHGRPGKSGGTAPKQANKTARRAKSKMGVLNHGSAGPDCVVAAGPDLFCRVEEPDGRVVKTPRNCV